MKIKNTRQGYSCRNDFTPVSNSTNLTTHNIHSTNKYESLIYEYICIYRNLTMYCTYSNLNKNKKISMELSVLEREKKRRKKKREGKKERRPHERSFI